MIAASLFAVFALGLRHGADPDHLAAIDNVTRSAYVRAPLRSRWVGTLFAGGHTIMVLAIAALVGYLGLRLSAQAHVIETAGTWVSIVVLFLLAGFNLRQLANGCTDRIVGLRTRLLPAFLRDGTSSWLAIPVGLLFGFGFETSSQIAAYAVVFGAEVGVTSALLVGSMFCVGMICTDTLDSVLVHRLVSYRAGRLPGVMRLWIWSVTFFAIAVALYELVQLFGVRPPLSDLTISGLLVGCLLAVFVWIFLSTRSALERFPTALEQQK